MEEMLNYVKIAKKCINYTFLTYICTVVSANLPEMMLENSYQKQ